LVALVALASLSAGCGPIDWPTFGFDSAHTRTTSDTAPSVQTVSNLNRAWIGITGGAVKSSPAVAGGIVYVASIDGRLYAYDAIDTGNCSWGNLCSPRWSAVIGSGSESSPAVANGVVYVGSSDGHLYAFDAHGSTNCTGSPVVCQPLWSARTAGAVSSSPVVGAGVVYVGANDGRLYAFDARGTTNCSAAVCLPLWSAVTDGAVSSSPAVAGTSVYVGSGDGKLYAFDNGGSTNCALAVCLPLWTGTTGAAVTSSPTVAAGVVYVGSSDHSLYAFDAAGTTGCASGTTRSCAPLWTAPTAGAVASSPAVSGGAVYVGSDDSNLYAFDANGTRNCSASLKLCRPLWHAPTGGGVRSSPAVANQVVYVGSSDGQFYAFDGNGAQNCTGSPVTCAPLWSQDTGGAVTSSPAISNGWIYVGSAGGSLRAYRLVISPVDATLAAFPVTPDGTDVFGLSVSAGAVTASAPGSNVGGNSRSVFSRRADATATDEQSCATWSSDSGRQDQEGAALRVHAANGGIKAITVTKNVWLAASWIFNVHVWDTSAPPVATQIGQFNLGSVFNPNNQLVPLPWTLCARVVGSALTFIVWPTNQPTPAWNDPTHGGSVTLPSGYSDPGAACWYIGHLNPGDSAVFTSLSSGPVTSSTANPTTSGPSRTLAPTTPPRAPTAIPTLP
jgi:outer membrane protein assembly factor BamB